MKILSLNLWGGMQGAVLLDYLRLHAETVDIFCFQEVFSALPGAPEVSAGARMYLFQELCLLFPEFIGYFEPRSMDFDFEKPVGFSTSHGLAVFVKNNLNVKSYRGEIIEAVQSPEDPVEGWTKAQVITLSVNGGAVSVINYHGVAQPGTKLDTPQRLSHMRKLQEVWQSLGNGPKILCGDFNLFPETQSIKLLEGLGRSLIKEFNIENTRNELSWKKYPGSKQKFADYTFVSPGVNVESFDVPYNEVSDHLPMIMEFKI